MGLLWYSMFFFFKHSPKPPHKPLCSKFVFPYSQTRSCRSVRLMIGQKASYPMTFSKRLCPGCRREKRQMLKNLKPGDAGWEKRHDWKYWSEWVPPSKGQLVEVEWVDPYKESDRDWLAENEDGVEIEETWVEHRDRREVWW